MFNIYFICSFHFFAFLFVFRNFCIIFLQFCQIILYSELAKYIISLMHIKKIILSGFKSYKNQMEIELSPGSNIIG